MGVLADPCYLTRLRRGTGEVRASIRLYTPSGETVRLRVKEIEAPDWMEIEGVSAGAILDLPARVTIRIDTDHRYFPSKPVRDERIRVYFEGDEDVTIVVTVPEVIG